MRYCLFFTINLMWLPLAQALTNCANQSEIPENECKALLSLFNSTQGAGWFDIFSGGWSISNTPCSWAGIVCRDGHVITIDRQNNGLNGSIPDLTDLTHLETLNLSHNQLKGSLLTTHLPSSLQALSLDDNQLSGTGTPLLPPSPSVDKTKITIVDDDTTTSPPPQPPPPSFNNNQVVVVSSSSSFYGPFSAPLCPTDKLSISHVCRAMGRTMPCQITIEDTASISGAVFTCNAKNQGYISNSTIKAGAVVRGEILTGYITNEGTLADFDFRGITLMGGTLSGTNTNNSEVGGWFQDVQLAPNTQLSGGKLKGEIKGDIDAPARLNNLEIKAGAKLSGVIIGENVQIGEEVEFGEGVIR